MPIEWGSVSWVYVGVLAVFVFLSSLIGSLLSFRHHLWGSALSALVFAAVFVFWSYYPHNVPLPTRLADRAAAQPAPPPPVTPAAPREPVNPVTDVTPPNPTR